MTRFAGLAGSVHACRASWRRAAAIGSLIVVNGFVFWGVLAVTHLGIGEIKSVEGTPSPHHGQPAKAVSSAFLRGYNG